MTNRLKQAEQALKQGKVVCVVITKDGTELQSELSGIRPLMDWLEKNPELLDGACVADKVVGKAAAMLMIYGGVCEVYTDLISESAQECLIQSNIPLTYGKKVPYIFNRTHTGMCPMEKCCLPISSPREAYEALKSVMKSMNHGVE